jgi:hypothetical protein
MVGIRSPIGLVVGSCTSHPGVLGSIPKREEPGKTGAPCIKVPGSSRVHDGRRQRGTACPLLYRYRLTHTYCSLARLPPTHPFVGAPILQLHFQVQWRARLSPPRALLPHTCTQDGWFLQSKRRPARLPRRTVPSNCICRWSSMRARLSLSRVLLPHTCTQDGWFLQPKHRPARLPRRTVPSNCICRCSRMRVRLPPTHTPPPHTGFLMSAHLSRLRLFQRHLRSLFWVLVWVWDWIHSHTPPRTRSPSSRHPPFTH